MTYMIWAIDVSVSMSFHYFIFRLQNKNIIFSKAYNTLRPTINQVTIGVRRRVEIRLRLIYFVIRYLDSKVQFVQYCA